METRLGFPDYRTSPPREISFDDDLRLAAELDQASRRLDFRALVELFYQLLPPARPGLKAQHLAHFDLEGEQAQAALDRLEAAGAGPLLDVGCGMGCYLAAAARRGREAVGVDVAVYQLVLARKYLETLAVQAELCLANAEALPFEDGSFAAVVGTDLLEHLEQPRAALSQVKRVLRDDGLAYFTTPNRFSLTAEPHVGVWGLGFLPRPWAERLVERRLGLDYRPIRPLSYGRLRALLREEIGGEVRIELPLPGERERAGFSAVKRRAASVYSVLSATPIAKVAVARVAPYFIAIGRKRPSGVSARG